jgi:hypothetical protein
LTRKLTLGQQQRNGSLSALGEFAAWASSLTQRRIGLAERAPDTPGPLPDEVGGSCSTGIECAKVQLSRTARKGATQ